MAIDDNTSYELTGYQVKDLAQKIRAKADSASLGAVAFSNLYADLTGAPTIPTVYNGTLTIQQNGTTIGTFSANQSTDTTINLTGGGATYTAGNGISITNDEISIDSTVVAEVSDLPTDFTGATSSTAGAHGLVPAPATGDEAKVLSGAGTWVNQPTVPTVNDATLTIQQNGTTVDTFTANSATNKTVNIQTITAETVAPAQQVGAITASMIDWSTMPGSYSTVEQKTPFTWIDDKPIYKKTVNFGALPNATSKTMAHGISSIDWIVNVESIAKRSDGVFCPTPLVPPGSTASTRYGFFEVDATNIVFYTGYNYSNTTAYVTLWYTKTTD